MLLCLIFLAGMAAFNIFEFFQHLLFTSDRLTLVGYLDLSFLLSLFSVGTVYCLWCLSVKSLIVGISKITYRSWLNEQAVPFSEIQKVELRFIWFPIVYANLNVWHAHGTLFANSHSFSLRQLREMCALINRHLAAMKSPEQYKAKNSKEIELGLPKWRTKMNTQRLPSTIN